MEEIKSAPFASHDLLSERIRPRLAFDASRDFGQWKEEVEEKLRELLGMDAIEANEAPDADFCIEEEYKTEEYTRIRFSFFSEVGERVPCYLLLPNGKAEKYPVAITLQGHSTGFHNSVGEIKFERDKSYQPRGAFGLQAVKNGYAALCIEQRAMGERAPKTDARFTDGSCSFDSLRALLLGRTVLGERVFDIKKAVDMLSHFSACDTEKILITGNSGGGTASFYAAAYDGRIGLCVPSCAFCSFERSILAVQHCVCNYIPRAFLYFEMGDLSALIAPRRIAVIAGERDPIFPIDGVRDAFATLSAIYEKAGARGCARLVETPMHHYWCEDIVWDTVNEEARALGWR